MNIHYLEIVTDEVDSLVSMYEQLYSVSFGEKVPEMGQARVAKLSNGNLIGIRAPLAEHESAIVRTYASTDDIEAMVKKAEACGGVVAYPPTRQGEWGRFAIVIHGGVQHGFWQQ